MNGKLRDPNAKLKHLDACLLEGSQYSKSAGFEQFELINQAGLALSLNDVSTEVEFCSRKFSAPLMISPMTGGVERGADLNRLWARAAQEFGLPMGVGSQRVAIEKEDRAGFFQIRRFAPSAFLFANLGAANLNRYNARELALRAVEMIEANAIFIHFNAMQEACQRADTDFRESIVALEAVCAALKPQGVKVFAREVGFGLSPEAARRFIAAGVDGVDCAGAGGTSWSKVEAMCGGDPAQVRLGQVFGEWGIPTAQSIANVRSISNNIPLVAAGGIRSGLDVAKALSLGADMVGMARPMLLAANESEEALHRFIESVLHELRVAMFASGCAEISDLKLSLGSSTKSSPIL